MKFWIEHNLLAATLSRKHVYKKLWQCDRANNLDRKHLKDALTREGGAPSSSLRLTDAVPVHEVFEPGGKVCHDSGGSQVKRPLEVLVVVQHPNVDLKPDASARGQRGGGI